MPDEDNRYDSRSKEDAAYLLEHFKKGTQWEIFRFEEMGVFEVTEDWTEVGNEALKIKTMRAEVQYIHGRLCPPFYPNGWKGNVYLLNLVARPCAA
jgi:hypothetical protein